MSSPCYAITGKEYSTNPADGRHYIPCNQTAVDNGGHTACCKTGDLCMTNGLCMPEDWEKSSFNYYFRIGCTDKTFKDPSCPNYCPDIRYPDSDGVTALINYCLESESWCCARSGGAIENWPEFDDVNTTCCNSGDLTFTANDPFIATTAVLRIAQSTPSPSATLEPSSSLTASHASSNTLSSTILQNSASGSHSASASTQTSAPSEGKSDSAALKVGLGVGLSLGLVLLSTLVAIVYLLRRRRGKGHEGESISELTERTSSHDPRPPYVEAGGNQVNETAGNQMNEVAGTVKYEAEGTTVVEIGGKEIPTEMYVPKK